MLKLKNVIIKYKIYIICICIIVLSIISVVIQSIDRKNSLKVNNTYLNKKEDKIAVYITGAVKNPGVYYLDEGARLYNILDICGGILENADIEKINLAKKLIDSEKVVIYEKKENDIDEDINLDNAEDEETIDKVNINTATKEELEKLTGIGESTANKIIEYRKKNSFIDIEDIMNVDGIGKSKFESIKDEICV